MDTSGRRRRLVGRAGVVLALLCLGYGATMVLLAVVGVHIDAPGLPGPAHIRQALRAEPEGSARDGAVTKVEEDSSSPGVGEQASNLGRSASIGAARAATPTGGSQPARSASTPTAEPTPSASPTALSASPTLSPTATPTPAATGTAHGTSATAPGASHRATPSAGPQSTDAPGHTRRSTSP